MKVEVKQEKKEFQPIEMTITFESEEELCNLWYRLNNRASDVPEPMRGMPEYVKFKANSTGSKLWNEIDEILIDIHS